MPKTLFSHVLKPGPFQSPELSPLAVRVCDVACEGVPGRAWPQTESDGVGVASPDEFWCVLAEIVAQGRASRVSRSAGLAPLLAASSNLVVFPPGLAHLVVEQELRHVAKTTVLEGAPGNFALELRTLSFAVTDDERSGIGKSMITSLKRSSPE